MIYDICNKEGYIIRKDREDGSSKKYCLLIQQVKSNGYSSPEDMLKKLIRLGCPDDDCSCELNTLCE